MYHCDWLANTGGPSYQGPPLKNSNGAATSSSRRWHLQIWWWHRQSDTLYVVAILSSSLTQMLQLLATSPCPRRPHPSFHTTAISRFPIFLFNFSLFLVLFLFNCFSSGFFIPAGCPNFFTASLRLNNRICVRATYHRMCVF